MCWSVNPYHSAVTRGCVKIVTSKVTLSIACRINESGRSLKLPRMGCSPLNAPVLLNAIRASDPQELRAEWMRQFLDVLAAERQALEVLERRIDVHIADVIELVLECSGHVIVSGMGKAGLVGQKIAASLSSTGTPAMFLHPSEALHGELGIFREQDLLLAISSSGETEELLDVVMSVRQMGITVIGMTGRLESRLARLSDVVVDVGVEREADPFNCVPTISTTVMLATGDAIAVTVMRARKVSREQLARLHPAGALGRRLQGRVADFMHVGSSIPIVDAGATVSAALVEMTEKRLGAAFVAGHDRRLEGIFTDGDLRRLLQALPNPLHEPISAVMTTTPRSVSPDSSVSQVLTLMEDCAITVVPVVDRDRIIVGAIHLHDMV